MNVLDEDPSSKKIKVLQEEIKRRKRVKKIFTNREESGKIISSRNVNDKWQGTHWILVTLADIGYPLKDETLFPVRDEILDFWLDDSFYKEYEAGTNKMFTIKRM